MGFSLLTTPRLEHTRSLARQLSGEAAQADRAANSALQHGLHLQDSMAQLQLQRADVQVLEVRLRPSCERPWLLRLPLALEAGRNSAPWLPLVSARSLVLGAATNRRCTCAPAMSSPQDSQGAR